eukprot:1176138-Prorocentrum_minimum.AAC.4
MGSSAKAGPTPSKGPNESEGSVVSEKAERASPVPVSTSLRFNLSSDPFDSKGFLSDCSLATTRSGRSHLGAELCATCLWRVPLLPKVCTRFRGVEAEILSILSVFHSDNSSSVQLGTSPAHVSGTVTVLSKDSCTVPVKLTLLVSLVFELATSNWRFRLAIRTQAVGNMPDPSDSLLSLKERVEKLRALRDQVKQKNKDTGAAGSSGVAAASQKDSHSKPAQKPSVSKAALNSAQQNALSAYTAKTSQAFEASSSSRAFPFQRLVNKGSSKTVAKTLLLFFLTIGFVVLFMEQEILNFDVLAGIISSEKSDSDTVATIATKLAAFQAGEGEMSQKALVADNPLGGDDVVSNETSVEEQAEEEADDLQLGGETMVTYPAAYL